MYCLIDFCSICFCNKEHLQPLSDSDSNNITYFIKLTSCFSEMCFNEMNDQWLVCNKCCETIDAAYKFCERCLRSKTTLTNYISQLHLVSNKSDAINIYLTDIKNELEKGNNIEQSVKFINMREVSNEDNNFEINPITEIKIENNPSSSELIDTEHIQFENVIIEMERKDQFFEENVEENLANPLVNQDEIRIGFNQNILTASAIKKENDNQDFGEHGRFDNILETCVSENDYIATKIEENDHILYSEKCSEDSLANLDGIKIDIVDNYTETVNTEINIQYKSENLEEFSTQDNVIHLKDEYKTDKDTNLLHQSLEGEQKKTLLSKQPKEQEKRDEIKQKEEIIKKYECNICKKKFTQLAGLMRHKIIHTGEKPYECDVCQKKFGHSFNLKEHMRIHTGEKPHACEICQKKFAHLCTLKEHIKTHTGEKPHECEACHKKFAQLSTLKLHMKIHTGEKPHECNLCHKKFAHIFTLRVHMKIHTGEKPYECSICQKKFNQAGHLRDHMKIHTGEKPHKCDVCQKEFIQLTSLMRHKRIHTGEKLYECSICQNKFTQSSTLKDHMKIHTGEKPHECDVCRKKFAHLYNMRKHMKIHIVHEKS